MKRHVFVMSQLIEKREISAGRVNKAKKKGTTPTAVQIPIILTNLNLSTAFFWDKFKQDKNRTVHQCPLEATMFIEPCNTKNDQPKPLLLLQPYHFRRHPLDLTNLDN